MKQTFSSLTQAESYMGELLRQAQEATLQEMLDKLLDFIDQDVYQVDNRASKHGQYYYDRTYILQDNEDAWKVNSPYIKTRTNGRQVYGSIEPNLNLKLPIGGNWQHQSEVPPYSDSTLTVPSYLKILNEGLSEAHSIFGEIEAKPFWDDFQKWAQANYSAIFAKHCTALGLNLGGASKISSSQNQYGSNTKVTW